MFGYLRFFLAFLVMLSHLGVRFYTLNPGVIAVVVFYILAGFVVSHLYTEIFAQRKNKLVLFYRDRFLRIYPMYLYVLILTIIFLLITSFGNPKFTFLNMFNNLTIIPLNYYMYIDSTVLTNPKWWLIPPAWSLGTELQAYLFLPFVFIYKRVKIILALLSLFVYIIANFSIINPDYFGYRLLVGVFFIFLLGSSIQGYKKNDKIFIYSVWILLLLLVPVLSYTGSFSPTYTKETLIGLLFGMPLVLFLSKTKKKLLFNTFFGALSYGFFLSHFLAIWILKYSNLASKIPFYHICQVTAISLFIAIIGVYCIEKKIDRVRYIAK